MKIFLKQFEHVGFPPNTLYHSWGARVDGDDGWCSMYTIYGAVGDCIYRSVHYGSRLNQLGDTKAKLRELFPRDWLMEDRPGFYTRIGKYCIDHAAELGFEFLRQDGSGNTYPLPPKDLDVVLGPKTS